MRHEGRSQRSGRSLRCSWFRAVAATWRTLLNRSLCRQRFLPFRKPFEAVVNHPEKSTPVARDFTSHGVCTLAVSSFTTGPFERTPVQAHPLARA